MIPTATSRPICREGDKKAEVGLETTENDLFTHEDRREDALIIT